MLDIDPKELKSAFEDMKSRRTPNVSNYIIQWWILQVLWFIYITGYSKINVFDTKCQSEKCFLQAQYTRWQVFVMYAMIMNVYKTSAQS